MKKAVELSSGEYTYYKYGAKEVGRIINNQPTGHGNDGRVFPYTAGKVIKLWYDDPEELKPEVKEEYINNLSLIMDEKLSFRYIYLPKRFVSFHNEIVGYIMHYFNGRNLKDISCLTSFRSLLNGLKRLEKELFIMSKHGYKLNDIHNKNLMVVQKHKIVSFGLMDPDAWTKVDINEYGLMELYCNNISSIRKIIFDNFLSYETINFINNNKVLSGPYQLIQDNKSDELSTFLYELMIQLENINKQKILTLSDFKSVKNR